MVTITNQSLVRECVRSHGAGCDGNRSRDRSCPTSTLAAPFYRGGRFLLLKIQGNPFGPFLVRRITNRPPLRRGLRPPTLDGSTTSAAYGQGENKKGRSNLAVESGDRWVRFPTSATNKGATGREKQRSLQRATADQTPGGRVEDARSGSSRNWRSGDSFKFKRGTAPLINRRSASPGVRTAVRSGNHPPKTVVSFDARRMHGLRVGDTSPAFIFLGKS